MVHQYKMCGYNIVLDICSGAIHVVDDVAYDIIALYEKFNKEDIVKQISEKYSNNPEITLSDIEECYDQLTELKAEGRLFTPDTFEDMAGELKRKTSGVVYR